METFHELSLLTDKPTLDCVYDMSRFLGYNIWSKQEISQEQEIYFDTERLDFFRKNQFLKRCKISRKCVQTQGICEVKRIGESGNSEIYYVKESTEGVKCLNIDKIVHEEEDQKLECLPVLKVKSNKRIITLGRTTDNQKLDIILRESEINIDGEECKKDFTITLQTVKEVSMIDYIRILIKHNSKEKLHSIKIRPFSYLSTPECLMHYSL